MLEIFLANLRAGLLLRGMNQKQLAEKSGLSETYISNLLKKQHNPTLDSLEQIAAAIEIPLVVLLYNKSSCIINKQHFVAGFLPAFDAFNFNQKNKTLIELSLQKD